MQEEARIVEALALSAAIGLDCLAFQLILVHGLGLSGIGVHRRAAHRIDLAGMGAAQDTGGLSRCRRSHAPAEWPRPSSASP